LKVLCWSYKKAKLPSRGDVFAWFEQVE